MSTKKKIYRGFQPHKYGKDGITVNGEYIRGCWRIGRLNYDGRANKKSPHIITDNSYLTGFRVLPETIGAYICNDSNGISIYDGDIVCEGLDLGAQIYVICPEVARDRGVGRRRLFRKSKEVYVLGNIYKDTVDSYLWERFKK